MMSGIPIKLQRDFPDALQMNFDRLQQSIMVVLDGCNIDKFINLNLSIEATKAKKEQAYSTLSPQEKNVLTDEEIKIYELCNEENNGKTLPLKNLESQLEKMVNRVSKKKQNAAWGAYFLYFASNSESREEAWEYVFEAQRSLAGEPVEQIKKDRRTGYSKLIDDLILAYMKAQSNLQGKINKNGNRSFTKDVFDYLKEYEGNDFYLEYDEDKECLIFDYIDSVGHSATQEIGLSAIESRIRRLKNNSNLT